MSSKSPDIKKMTEEKDLDSLLNFLNHPDVSIRREAAEGLKILATQEIVDENIYDKLVKAFGDKDKIVSNKVQETIIIIQKNKHKRVNGKTSESVDFIETLNTSDPLEIIDNGETFNVQKNGPTESKDQKSLKKGLSNVGWTIGIIIVIFLVLFGIIGGAMVAGGAYHKAKVSIYNLPDVVDMQNNGDVDGLIKALNSSDAGVRKDAAIAIGHLTLIEKSPYATEKEKSYNTAKAVEPLKLLLNDKDVGVKGEAALTLGDIIGVEPAAEMFVNYISSTEEAEQLAEKFKKARWDEDDGLNKNVVMRAIELYVKKTGANVWYRMN